LILIIFLLYTWLNKCLWEETQDLSMLSSDQGKDSVFENKLPVQQH
jgi:hypothetical protein